MRFLHAKPYGTFKKILSGFINALFGSYGQKTSS